MSERNEHGHLPNPYLDDPQTESEGNVSALFGAITTLAVTFHGAKVATAQYAGMWATSMIHRGVSRQGDESTEEMHSRSARAALWSLANAVHLLAKQGVPFVVEAETTNDGCTCGTDHVAESKAFQEFLTAAVANEPDSALSGVMTYLEVPENRGPDLSQFVRGLSGRPTRSDAERYFVVQLLLCAARSIVQNERDHWEAERQAEQDAQRDAADD